MYYTRSLPFFVLWIPFSTIIIIIIIIIIIQNI
jgi:hypothetical protein